MTRNFGAYRFEFVAAARPATDAAGKIVEYAYKLPAGVRPNRYGLGPFCRFQLEGAATGSGVYAITVGDDLKYIGECENLSERFGPNGYGYIAARNCFSDGQATNCKVNSLILASAKAGDSIGVWFHPTTRRMAVEAQLVDELRPPWNGRRGSGTARSIHTPVMRSSVPTVEIFRRTLEREFAKAGRAGLGSVIIRAGDLHRTVGGYPGNKHRMPVCCQVMKSLIRPGDNVLETPRSGAGASLTIEYRLPRRI